MKIFNDIIKTLNESNLFSNVQIKTEDNKYRIEVYPHNELNFNNDRLKDEDLELTQKK